MDVINMKRIVMFTWLDEEEMDWLFMLDELETRKDEFEIEDLVDGLGKFIMTEEEMARRDRALLGLREEGLIKMDAVFFEYLDVKELSITQRGRKVLAEARCILKESEPERSFVDNKLIEMEKKDKQKESIMEFTISVGVSVASAILNKVFLRN